jgi:hypothetical protein
MQPPVPPASHEVMAADRPIVYYLLTGAILTLAGVIAVLWRRGERSRDRALKAAEEAREREVQRTQDVLKGISDAQAKFAASLETQRELYVGLLDRQRADFDAALRATVERQAQADMARDSKMAEVITALGRLIEAAQSRITSSRRS